ncbi:MAG: GIY-YIG nuclease family protein [Patescibacteria group bacterium]
MFAVYILQSDTSGRYYIGSTKDIEVRLAQHNRGKVIATRNKGPWQVIYTETFLDRKTAYAREQEIKSYKGGNSFTRLIKS